MKKATPHIVSLLLTLSTLLAMPSALAQTAAPDAAERPVEAERSANRGMISSAAQSISQTFSQSVGSIGGWLGLTGESVPEPTVSAISVDDSKLFEANLRLDAFPGLSAADESLRLLDVSREHSFLDANPGAPQELDLSASYIWESPRFGQFILSTNTTYVYNTNHADVARESAAKLSVSDNVTGAFGMTNAGMAPELQSSLTFTWQIGNHTATAVTSYVDGVETFGKLGNDNLNIEQLNELMGEIATLDLSYGYNVKAGRQGNASISVGVRSQFDRRQLTPAISPAAARMLNTPDRMAYGTIKYQF